MRGDPTILPSLPELGSRTGGVVFPALQSEEDEPDACPLGELGMGAPWLSGMLAELGVLGALTCDALALEAPLEAALGEGLGAAAGTGGGLLGAALAGALGAGLLAALLVEECWANTAEENNKITATARLESRITHLLPTERSERQIALFLWTLPSTKRVPRNRVKERNDCVENCYFTAWNCVQQTITGNRAQEDCTVRRY